jgi:allantoate deiminase
VKIEKKSLGQEAVDACKLIAGFSENPENITRTYLSPLTRQVHEFLKAWMGRLGMESWVDAAGNLRGIHRGRRDAAQRLLIGSHIDTVPNAGAFDGVLGVVIGLILIEALNEDRLDFEIEVIAFSEEEGVRFRTPFIGSRAVIGDVDNSLLSKVDTDGITLAEAIRDFGLNPSDLACAALDENTFAYIEFHIEQGPVLDDQKLSLGIVDAIAGQSRYQLTFHGHANHAGTTPMHLRRDALAGAAEWITAVEREARATTGLVATVGHIEVLPGATNVVAGEARLSLDVRHGNDATRTATVTNLLDLAGKIAAARDLSIDAVQQLDQPATPMDSSLAEVLETASIATGVCPHRMVSGAGHDAMVLAKRLPSAMLFLRSPGGISHHPEESVLVEDVQAAIDAGLYFLKHLDAKSIAGRKR